MLTNGFYVVVSKPNPGIPNLTLYKVKSKIGRSRIKVLHRNLLLPIPCLPVKTPKADTANVETTPTVIAQKNDDIADGTNVSDVGNEISCAIRPCRAPVPAPSKTKPRTPVAGKMAETVPSPKREHSVNETDEQIFLKYSSSVLEQGTLTL